VKKKKVNKEKKIELEENIFLIKQMKKKKKEKRTLLTNLTPQLQTTAISTAYGAWLLAWSCFFVDIFLFKEAQKKLRQSSVASTSANGHTLRKMRCIKM
jgi:hypothetical protein